MTIPMKCGCGKSFHVPDDSAGRQVRCAGCGTVLKVPAGEVEAVPGPRGPEEYALREERPGEAPGNGPREKRAKSRKRPGKKSRRGGSRNPYGETLEERMARREEEGARGRQIWRGLYYVATAVALLVVGILGTWLLAELAKGDEILRGGYGLLTLLYKATGIWGPLVICGIGSLIPLTIGILNLIGISVIVEQRDD